MYGRVPEDLGIQSGLDREVRDSLATLAEREIAARSMSGALVYFIVTLVLAFATPYYSDHPLLITAIGSVTFVLGGCRMLAAHRLRQYPGRTLRSFTLVLYITIYGTFLVWGLFCAWTLQLYGGGWTAMLLLLSTASLAGGGTSSLAPDLPLAWRCLIILIGPTVVSAAVLGDPRHWGLAGLAFLYLCFLLTQARDNWRAFWTATIAAEQEKIRGSAERVRAERERASLAVAIEQTAEAILITDAEGNIRYCNPAFERISGYSRQEVLGKNPRLLKSGKQSLAFYEDLWKTITGGGVWSGHLTNRKKDGSLWEEDAAISPIRDESGNVTGFVAASRDVTEQVSLESRLRQAQKLESIGRLAGGVAHDFNNLLTVINGYSEMALARLHEGDSLRDLLMQIRKAGERAAGLTRQLLTFSRKQVIEPRRVGVNELILESAGMLRRIVREDIEIGTDLRPDAGYVMADPGQLHEILINLVLNARDAMPSGGRLTLRSARVELDAAASASLPGTRPGPFAVMEVSDTGVGMNDEIQQKAFDPFFTTKPEGSGTGLGLSAVYGIVRQSGGWIRIESRPGMGTTLRIGLPLLQQSDAGASPASPRPDGPPPTETILVVEDQDEVRRFVVAMLERFRYRTLEANSGDEAVLLVENHGGPIHLMLTDVIMPGMTGKQAADRLRTLRPQMKVLYMSGYSDDVISREGLLDPGIDYLAKPFTADALAEKIRVVLGKPAPGAPVD